MRDPSAITRALLTAGAAAAGVAAYALLRPLLRRTGERDAPETFAVAGSRKPSRAARADSDDPLERIESQVVAREAGR